MKWMLFGLLAVLLSLMLIGCGETTPSVPAEEEFIEITARELYDAYDNNEIAADLKYKGKMLKVNGIVDNVGEDIFGSPYVVIVGNEGDWWGVQVSYPDTQGYREMLAELNTGESVTVTGKCTGYLLNVLLEHK